MRKLKDLKKKRGSIEDTGYIFQVPGTKGMNFVSATPH